MPELKYPEIDYGPLLGLIGNWSGDKGMDISPEPKEGTEENPYFETIEFEEVGALQNAKMQDIVMVRYLQVVRRHRDQGVFHDQTGYWMWDPAKKLVMFSLAIPRGLCLLAGGSVEETDDGLVFDVKSAKTGDWTITQAPFMLEHASTEAFTMKLTLNGDSMSYTQETSLKIYGKDFAHTDENVLSRS